MNFKDLRRAFRYRAGRTFVEATTRLPVPLGRALYGFFGTLAWALVSRDRRIASRNLAAAFPEWDSSRVRRMTLRVFRELLRNIYDVAAFPRWPAGRQFETVRVRGTEHLERARANGSGALLMGGHQGAWELIAVGLGRAGFPVRSFSRPISEPRLERWLSEHRAALGISTLPRHGISAALEARRVLKRGGLVGVLLDHRIRKGGLILPFFGRPARFAAGPARLALRAGVPILPVRIHREEDGGHLIEIGAAIPVPDATIPRARRWRLLLGSCVSELEAMIRRTPEEWAWMHPRWDAGALTQARTRPLVAGASHLALTLVCLAVFSAAGCGAKKGPDAGPGTEYTGPSSALGGFRLTETDSGRLKWILKADSADTFDDNLQQTLVANPHVDFYNSEREIYSVLTAEKGVVQGSTRDMTAQGRVRIVTTAGDTLTTETLEWHNVQARVRTADTFRLARPDVVLTGRGFESDQDLKNYKTEDVRIDARGSAGNVGS